MRSLRIAHTADTHLGYRYSVLPNRDEDFTSSWLYACRDIVNSSPDLILHAGDVFHTHRPDWKALTAFSQGLDILREAEVPIFIIAGNHDTSGVLTNHTVFSFTSTVYPQIISTNAPLPSTHHVAALDVDVVLVPHRSLLNPLLDTYVEEIVAGLTGSFSVLVSHGSISRDAIPSEPGSIAIPHALTEYPWNYMAFGHLHLAQPYKRNGWYSGSTERCGWSDYPASPAWTLVEVGEDKSVRHAQMPVPHMQFIDLPDLDCVDLSPADVCLELVRRLEQRVVPAERCHIRMKTENLSNSIKYQVDMMVRKTVGREHPKAVVSINLDNPAVSFFADYDVSTKPKMKPIPELFKEFVEDQHYEDPTFGKRFLDRGLDALARGGADDVESEHG